MHLNPAFWSLKSKFVSILLLVLLIPVSSVFLLKEIEKSLVDSLKQNLLLTSKFYSLQLENNSNWFEDSNLPMDRDVIAKDLFVFPLQQTVVLDGYFDEWLFVEKFRQEFYSLTDSSKSKAMGVTLGSEQEQLYVSIKIVDAEVRYGNLTPNSKADFLVINFVNQDNVRERLFFSANAPGKIPVKKHINSVLKIDWRYVAYWAETEQGFNLEIKFPASIKPRQLQITHYDRDLQNDKLIENNITTSQHDLNPLVWPSKQLSDYVRQLSIIPGQRVWVLDTFGRVLARNGSLNHRSNSKALQSGVMNWLLTSQNDVVDARGDQLRLDSPVIFEALRNRAASTLENSDSGEFAIAIATSPIVHEGKVVGAILLEENVARVQLLQKQTLLQLIYVMLAIILAVISLIVWYVTRLVRRISRLKKQVTQVTDDEGRMLEPVEFEHQYGDEVAELNNAFAIMSNRLFEYNDYLEKLASRLSHELRTPIAIVRSSLDNLMLNYQEQDSSEIVQRALEGTQRLSEIITRMREASGIRQAMQTAGFEDVELNQFMQQIIKGFSATFTNQRFEFEAHEQEVILSISPDLFAELMDKLLANAMDFSRQDKPIVVSLTSNQTHIRLSVSNQGDIIATKHLKKIFYSLVSIRTKQQINLSGIPNLGLGLHLVKLIAEFHHARVVAENLEDASGVKFSVIWQK